MLGELISPLKGAMVIVDCPEDVFNRLRVIKADKHVIRAERRFAHNSYFISIKWVHIGEVETKEAPVPELYNILARGNGDFEALVDVYHDMGTGPVRTFYWLKRDVSGAWMIIAKRAYLVT